MNELYLEEFEESMSAWVEIRGVDANAWGRYREFQERGLKYFLENSLRDAVNRKLGVELHFAVLIDAVIAMVTMFVK